MFHTDREPAELQALTTYSEKHGEERESGLALKLSVTMSNTVLDLFDPQLRPAFYRANDGISAQTDQPQADTPTPVLKMPPLTGHRWSKQITGAVVEISGDDLLGASNVRVTEATVDNFAFNMLEGGSVETTLRIKCKPDPEDVGALYERLRQTVLVTIRPPEHAQYEEGDDNKDDDHDDAQGDMLDDDDQAESEADPLASAVLSGGSEPAQSSATVTHRRRRKADRAFPDAADGTASTAQDALAGA